MRNKAKIVKTKRLYLSLSRLLCLELQILMTKKTEVYKTILEMEINRKTYNKVCRALCCCGNTSTAEDHMTILCDSWTIAITSN